MAVKWLMVVRCLMVVRWWHGTEVVAWDSGNRNPLQLTQLELRQLVTLREYTRMQRARAGNGLSHVSQSLSQTSFLSESSQKCYIFLRHHPWLRTKYKTHRPVGRHFTSTR